MAIYHLTAKIGSRARGQSARAKAQYVLRLGPYAKQTEALAFAESGNLPEFAYSSADGTANPVAYWEAADLYERKNGRLFREVEVALPIELEPDEQRELIREFVTIALAGESLPYTFAIHGQDGPNPHCHLLVSERVNDRIERPAELWFRRFKRDTPEHGGALKTENLDKKSWLFAIREAWANLVNRALERAGFLERVDHRSLAAQGLERMPQVHIGPQVRRMEQRGLVTGRGDLAEQALLRRDQLAARVAVRRQINALERGELGRRARSNSVGESDENSSLGLPKISPSDSQAEASRDGEVQTPGSSEARPPGSEIDLSRSPASLGREATSQSPDAAESGEHNRTGSNAKTTATAPRLPSDFDQDQRPVSATEIEPEYEPHAADPPELHARPNTPPIGDRESPYPPARAVEPRTTDHLETDDPDRAIGPAGDALGRHRVGPYQGQYQREQGPPAPAEDRTARAVAGQLRAMGCERYEIGIREAATGRFIARQGTSHDVLKQLSWLKRMNALGNDIYVRPARGSARNGLVLLDDLDRQTLRKLEREGRDPAVVVETSPGSFQSWIRVAREVGDIERADIARSLTHQYGADPATRHAHPYGRLAGFTNRKPRHRSENGVHPFALLRGASGRVAPDGRTLLGATARTRSELERSPVVAHSTPPALSSAHPRSDREREAVELYRREMLALLRRTRDVSRADFGAASRLAARGFDSETIESAMRAASPALERRKHGHVEDYIRRTIEAATRATGRSRQSHSAEPELDR